MIDYEIIDLSTVDDAWVKAMLKSLPKWYQNIVAKVKPEQGRKEKVVAFDLLGRMLCDYFGIQEVPEFEYGEHGKPRLKGHPEVEFNISHCKEAVMVAVGNEPVGVDIESRGRYKDQLAKHVLNDEEYERLQSEKNKDLMFTELWTIKEAILKYTGEGISTDMKSVIPEHDDITLLTMDGKDYVWAIATEKHS